MITTYTVKSKQRPDVWVFKYHLNGVLKSFEVLEGIMEEEQLEWLYKWGNYPYQESVMKKWQKKPFTKHFDITVGLPDLSFESFWETYDKKVKKLKTQKIWERLSKAKRLKALEGISRYNNYLRLHNGIAKCNPDTYINQERWTDEN